MNNPPVQPHNVADIAARLKPNIPRGSFATQFQGPAQQDFTADGAIEWLIHFLAAVHRTPRLPIDLTHEKHDDGSLTIRAVPIR